MTPVPRPRSRALRYAPAVAWTAVLVAASVVDPGSFGNVGGPGGPGGSVGGVGPPPRGPLGVLGFDKWLHAAGYATLALLVAAALSARDRRRLALAALVAVAVGAGVEVVQYPLAARSTDVADALANAVGTSLGVGVWMAVAFGRRRLRNDR